MNRNVMKFIAKQSLHTANHLDLVVTPEIYEKIFIEFCKVESLNYSEIFQNENFIQDDILKLKDIIDSAEDGVRELKDKTDRVSKAIKNKDEKSINILQTEIDQLQNKLFTLEKELYIDELTKAYNRKWLYDKKLDKRDNLIGDGTFVLIDLNDFKEINDNFGHITGDKVLKILVDFFKKTVDSIVRYGGDEFLIFFDSSNVIEVENSILKTKELITSKRLSSHNKIFNISFSFGVINYSNGDAFSEKLKIADEFMYKDKENKKKIKAQKQTKEGKKEIKVIS